MTQTKAKEKSASKKLKVEFVRQTQFSCAHLYYQPSWGFDQNSNEFGKCFTQHGHGHNYTLEVALRGPVNQQSGMILNLKEVDKILNEVKELLDHKHLNFDVKEFLSPTPPASSFAAKKAIKDKNKIELKSQVLVPTTENISLFCWQEIEKRLKKFNEVHLVRVRVYETPAIWAEVSI
jgi:6-pyruvoyltetrahydropterin/6-carboxytetrahydropterin synthase